MSLLNGISCLPPFYAPSLFNLNEVSLQNFIFLSCILSVSLYSLLVCFVDHGNGLTNSNYKELNQLYEKYKDQGFEIVAFPCNQFGEQEPGSNEEITDFVCTRFKSEFPIFDKIEVNGDGAAPVYKFLKSGKWGIFGDEIQWNFSKFLVGKDGKVSDRYYPTTPPLSLEHNIKKLLGVE